MSKRPWVLVILAFVVLIGAWVWLIMVAHHHAPEEIPLPPPSRRPGNSPNTQGG